MERPKIEIMMSERGQKSVYDAVECEKIFGKLERKNDELRAMLDKIHYTFEVSCIPKDELQNIFDSDKFKALKQL